MNAYRFSCFSFLLLSACSLLGQSESDWQWFLNGLPISSESLSQHIFCLDRPDSLEFWYVGEVEELLADSLTSTWTDISLWGQLINQQAIKIGQKPSDKAVNRPAIAFTLHELGARTAIPYGQLSTRARLEVSSLLIVKGSQAYESLLPPLSIREISLLIVRDCE